MKILIIEDDNNKFKKLLDVFLKKQISQENIILKTSYNSGVRELIKNDYDFLILDMSLPIYENEIGRNNNEIKPFAGIDILNQMKRYEKEIPTVIVTQFEVFSLATNTREEISITELKEKLKELKYQSYRGLIYYDVTSNYWEKDLIELLELEKG